MSPLFWTCLAFLVYTFAGYPVLLLILGLVRPRTHHKTPYLPPVSLIITAYNEAGAIDNKIRNSLQLRYPACKLEIIVASDGSNDATAAIVRSHFPAGVRLVELPERRGKHHAQMVARDASHGDILVFSDSSIYLEADALQNIVANFADPAVGCVSSEDRVLAAAHGWLGEASYLGYEMWLRRLETRAGSLVGASGSFFAARRELCEGWHSGQSSDFFIPLHAAARGLRSVVDPTCVGSYGLAPSTKAEFQRKVRTIVHGLDVLFTHLPLLNLFRFGLFSWQLASHKLFRWLAPFAAVALFLSSLFLWNSGTFYRLALILQASLYAGGLLALLLSSVSDYRLLRVAGLFVLGNAATITAWVRFCLGEKFVSWEPTHRS